MFVVYLGFLILAVQLSSVVTQIHNTTTSPTAASTSANTSTKPATTTPANNCGRSDSFLLLLLPLALTASVLHSWS
ncbi:hypothetical protein Q8A73_017143 [Channa argus]|nr:hypothetical protein Q8A73_017143 [Channa argus]